MSGAGNVCQTPQSSLSSDPTASVPVFLAGRMASTKQNLRKIWSWGGIVVTGQPSGSPSGSFQVEGAEKSTGCSPPWTGIWTPEADVLWAPASQTSALISGCLPQER